MTSEEQMTQRLQTYYYQTIVPKLITQFKYKNKFQVPYISKIVINRGLGDASEKNQLLTSALQELAIIAGQRGVITRSKKAIAGFKLGQKMAVGVCVTIRGDRMYSFLDRLINLALPRIRDFRGINPKSFDGRGNYTLGLEEQLMFPEIEYDDIEEIKGMDISIVTTSKTDLEGRALLKEFGLPLQIY